MNKKIVKKILKTILIILLVLFVLFLLHSFRNFMIIRKLQKSIEPYLSSTNYHLHSINSQDNGDSIVMDYYKKGSKETSIIERVSEKNPTKISTYINDESVTTYIDTPSEKYVTPNRNIVLSINIYNWCESDNNWQTFLISAFFNIRTSKYNEKDCYIISNFFSPYFLYESFDSNLLYVEKDTGLLLKTKVGSMVSERSYEFNTVNDSFFVQPNINEYTLKED